MMIQKIVDRRASSQHLALAAYFFLTLLSPPSSAFIAMNWNTSYHFGPDRPWQGVIVGINDSYPIDELQPMTLLRSFNTQMPYLLTPELCSGNFSTSGSNCGVGGTTLAPKDQLGEIVHYISDSRNMSGYAINYAANASRALLSVGQQV